MPGWRVSSCFDCTHLQENPAYKQGLYCGKLKTPLSYQVARTVNDCEYKKPFVIEGEEQQRTTREVILAYLYETCEKLSYDLARPFAIRDLSNVVEYKNKNSLWELLEDLTRQKKLKKGMMTLINSSGRKYRMNVYLPTSLPDNLDSTVKVGNQVQDHDNDAAPEYASPDPYEQDGLQLSGEDPESLLPSDLQDLNAGWCESIT